MKIIFIHDWMITYGVQSYVLVNISTQFLSSSLFTLWAHLNTKHLTATACHLQTNWNVEWYNKTFVTWVFYYLGDYTCDCKNIFQPLIYAYDLQVNMFTNTAHFSLVLIQHPPGLMKFNKYSTMASVTYHLTGLEVWRQHLLFQINALRSRANESLKVKHNLYKSVYDKGLLTKPTFQSEKLVYIDKSPH